MRLKNWKNNGSSAKRRPNRKELHEVKELEKVFAKLDAMGLSIDTYGLTQGESDDGEKLPTRYELVCLDAKGNQQIHPVAGIDGLISTILDSGKQSIEIKRFKGLGEMDADQLWETTMNPVNRTLLKVSWDAASQAGHLFSILMGEDVEPRRQYIEDHALEVKNLDV